MFDKSKLELDSFFIAEVGQNHQGDLEKALKYIKIFSAFGAHAVKFQTRNNKYLFDDATYVAPYASDNAFAETYGAHREALELNPEWLPILKQECDRNDVAFMSTPFDEPSLELLEDVGVDILKIASFDLGNLPFIDKIARTGKPVVMSIGGGNVEQIRDSVRTISQYHNNIAVLHCVSEYPCEYTRLGLANIGVLAAEFPDCVIGLSDHFSGILSGPVAFMKGARVFEKHVTLNRAWKGTDHSFALEPEGFRKLVRDTERVRHMMTPKPKAELGKESVFKKLGKSIIAAEDLKSGDVLGVETLSGRIFTDQIIPVRESSHIIGRTLKQDVKKGSPIRHEYLEER